MPEWADFDKLPYINSIVKEGMRWRPAYVPIHSLLRVGIDICSVATGIPRRVAEDDWYNGMLIPKDSTVFLPIWAVHHAEGQGYKDSYGFNPDRYIDHHKLANDYAGSADYSQRGELRRPTST